METKKSKFDGLVVKFNDKAITGRSDCQMCCLNCDNVGGCPLLSHYYFENPSKFSSKLTSKEQYYLTEVIQDLRWLANNLEWSLTHALVLSSTIAMSKSSLDVDKLYLSKIKSFDD